MAQIGGVSRARLATIFQRHIMHRPFFLARRAIVPCLAAALALMLVGCASTSETAAVDRLTADVGNYPAPPTNVQMPALGVPQMSIQGSGGAFGFNPSGNARLEEMAADQLTTLWMQTDRFRVIERAQLEQLLSEQGLEGIVRPDELAAMGQVRGTDYLCLGRVTNFEVRVDRRKSGMRVGSGVTDRMLGRDLRGVRGGFDKQNTTITISCGVDLRLVDPASGEIWVAEQSDFNRELRADALGFDLDIFRTRADADIRVTESDAGKLLRLALDQSIREMLPDVDAKLRQQWREGSAADVGGEGADRE